MTLLTEEEMDEFEEGLLRARLSNEQNDNDSIRKILKDSKHEMQWGINPDAANNSKVKTTGTESATMHFELLKELDKNAIQLHPGGELQPDLPPLPEIVTGSNAAELTSKDKHAVAVARRHIMYNLTKQERGEDALWSNMKQWYNEVFHPEKLMSASEATAKYRSAGLDIKADKPLTQESVDRAINIETSRRTYTQLLEANEQGGDVGTWNNILMYGSSLMGYIGPVELASTIILGAAIPHAAVAGVAKGADFLNKALKLKKVKDIAGTINALRKAESIVAATTRVGEGVGAATRVAGATAAAGGVALKAGETAAALGRAGETISAASKVGEVASGAANVSKVARGEALFQGAEGQAALEGIANAQKAGKIAQPNVYEQILSANSAEEAQQILQQAIVREQQGLNWAKLLEPASEMKYDSLGIGAKTLADMTSVPLVDFSYIQGKYIDSQNLGLGYYSERDRMAESLMAAFSAPGILIPARFVGSKFLKPHAARAANNIKRAFRNIDVMEAMGEITPEQAAAERGKLNKALGTEIEKSNKESVLTERQAERLKQYVEELESMNIDSAEAYTGVAYALECLKNGAPLDLSKLPGNTKMLLSNIDARLLSRGVQEGFENVFEKSIVKTISKSGVTSIEVTAEGGLAKGYKFWGLTEQEAIDNLNDYYKGFVVGDEEAKLRFQNNAARLAQFIDDAEELQRIDTWMHDVNSAVKKGALPESEKISFAEQRILRKDALIDMYLNKEYPDLNKEYPLNITVEKNRVDSNTYKGTVSEDDLRERWAELTVLEGGSPDLDKFNEITRAVDEANDFANKFHNKGKGCFEQLQSNFQEYLDELNGAMHDMDFLMHSDDYARHVGSEKIAKLAVEMANGGFSPDALKDVLFGFERITSEEFADVTKETIAKKALVAESRLNLAKIYEGDEFAEAINSLEKDSVAQSNVESMYIRSTARIKAAQEVTRNGFAELEGELYKYITETNESMQKVLFYIDPADLTARNIRAVRNFVQSSIYDVLQNNKNIATVLDKKEMRALATDIGNNFQKAVKNNPDMVGAFLSQENRRIKSGQGVKPMIPVDEGKTVGEMTTSLQKDAGIMKQTALHAMAWKQFYTMVDDVITSRVMDIELQEANNVQIMVEILQQMRNYPEIAAEILTGRATQTVYSYLGSRRSVESSAKVAQLYKMELYTNWKKVKSTDGLSLYDWAMMPENKNEIFEMKSRILRGEEIQNKGNAYRVAKDMVDSECSIKRLFKRYGAEYNNFSETIDRSKLRFADSAIDPAEKEVLQSNMASSFASLTEDTVIATAGVDTLGIFRWGRKLASVSDVETRAEITEQVEKIRRNMEALIGDGTAQNDSVTFWMFKNLDLDAMWDKDGRRLISLNAIRDKLVEGGKLTDLLSSVPGAKGGVSDAYDIVELAKGVEKLREIFRGKRVKTKAGEEITVPGAADEFISGYFDLRATNTRGQVASTRLMDNQLIFRGVDEEIQAMSRFGYDTLDDYLTVNSSKMASALAVLERFGSSPLEMADTLIATYNTSIKRDRALASRLRDRRRVIHGGGDIGEKAAEKYLSKMAISEGAAKSVRANVRLACGLENYAPSAGTQAVNLIKMVLSSPMLVSAGLKSFADTSTTVTGLLMNGMAESSFEGWGIVSDFMQKLTTNADLRHMQYGCTILSGSQVFKAYSGDPIGAAYMSSTQFGNLDKAKEVVSKFSNWVMNGIGRMESITNLTKQNAAWCISYSVARNADKEFSQLPKKLQSAFMREGFVSSDWDFIRKHGISNMYAIASENGVKVSKGTEKYGALDIIKMMELDDLVYAKEMERRGIEVITPESVADFKHGILSKTWAMLDSGSDEMVSIPSGRIQNIMHGYYPKNSGLGTVWDIASQYQSFGASLLYNNYIKYLAYHTEGETGVTVLDMFNPRVRLSQHSRAEIFKGLGAIWLNIAMGMLVADSVVNTMKGNIQSPIDENGVHVDLLGTTLLGSLGIFGTLIEAAWDGLEGAGQRGGGLAFQVAPSISNAVRIVNRLSKPLTSSRVPEGSKGEAFAAGVAQEIGRMTGLKTSPFTALAWQYFFGAMLDEMYSGGRKSYNTYLKGRERRGYHIFDFEKYPEFGFEF